MLFDKKSTIVIGGGIGGLVAAISLAQRGFDVSLYEKNSEFGGKMQTITNDEFQFDIGTSILTTPNIIEQLFQKSKLNMSDYIEFVELKHQSKTFFDDGLTLNLYNQLGKLRADNVQITDDDIRDYEDYLSEAKRIYEASYGSYFEDTADDWESYRNKHTLLSLIRNRSNFMSLQKSINKYIKNPYLRDVLGMTMYETGSSAQHAPALYNAMNYLHYKYGVWYVRGGAHNLTEGLVQLAADLGVNLNNEVEVKAFHHQDDQLTGVELSTGEVVHADYYISNTSPPAIKQRLSIEETDFDVPSAAPSAYIMLLGVSSVYEALSYHNVFLSSDMSTYDDELYSDKKIPTDPMIIVMNTSQLEETHAKSGFQNLKIVTPIPNLNDFDYNKGDYVYLRHRILSKLESAGLIGLREHITSELVFTPDDIKKKFHSDGGALNGVSTDMRFNKGFKYRKQSPHFKNLYFVGASVHPSATLSMVVLNAQQVVNMIVEQEDQY